MRKLVVVLCLFFILPHSQANVNWASKVHEIRLKNGMKFLLYQRGEAPVFSAYVRFRAGGMDEEVGKTGLAHFLEHMAFKGTETIGTTNYAAEKPILEKIEAIGEELSAEYGKGKSADSAKILDLKEKLKILHQEEEKYLIKEELTKRVMENGGLNQNATTNKDMTSYFVSLPSDKLRFWAETESERIFHPIFREFYEEKEVVREERRMRVENDPDGRLHEALLEAAFDKSPYRWPTIGYDEDLVKLTVQDLKAFWKKYYHPSNAIGVLVGRFDVREAEKILNQTFGKITPISPATLTPTLSPQGRGDQSKERRVVLKLNARPRLWIAYHKPTLPDVDDYLFDLLDQILGDGRSSRLYRRLVLEKKVASQVGTTVGMPGSRLPNLFVIYVDLLEGHTPAEALQVIDAEIRRLQKEAISPREVERAKNRLSVDLLWQLKSNEGLASQLSYYEMVAGDWHYLANYLETIDRFTGEDLQRLSQKYLIPANRTVAEIRP